MNSNLAEKLTEFTTKALIPVVEKIQDLIPDFPPKILFEQQNLTTEKYKIHKTRIIVENSKSEKKPLSLSKRQPEEKFTMWKIVTTTLSAISSHSQNDKSNYKPKRIFPQNSLTQKSLTQSFLTILAIFLSILG